MLKYTNDLTKNSSLLLIFAIVSSAFVMSVVGIHTYKTMEKVLENSRHSQLILGRVENIRFLDEALTNSTILCASTGNSMWEERFRFLESKLDSAINELILIDSLCSSFLSLKMTENANVQLKAIEQSVFELIHLQKQKEAFEIITSSEYATQKANYSDGLDSFIKLHKQETDQQQAQLLKEAKISIWFFGLAVILLTIIWLPIERFFRKSRKLMIKQNQELEIQIQAREESERALLESKQQIEKAQEQLQESITASNVGLWERNLQTNVLFQSPEFKKQIGYTDDDIQSPIEFYYSHLHPEDAAIVLDSIQQLKNGEIDKLKLEYRFCHKDGSYLWMLSHTSLKRDQFGKPWRLFGSHIDITERKNSEQTIKELNERFNLIAKATNDCVYDWDIVTDQIWWNPALSRLFNYPPEIITTDSQWWKERIHPDDHDSLMQDAQNVFDAKMKNFRCEYRFQRADGSYAFVFDRAIVLYDENKNPIRWIGSVMDITERMKAEARLKESEEKYRLLAESSPEMIYLIDTKGCITYLNKVAAAQFHAPVQELVGKHLTEIFPPDLAQLNLERIQNVIATKISFHNEVEMVFPKGSRWVDARLNPVFDDQNRVVGVLGLSYDITDRKRADETVAALSRRYHILLHTASDGIHVLDDLGNVIEVNEAFCTMLGYTREELLQLNVADWDIQWSDSQLAEKLQEFFHQSFMFETRHRRKDGSSFDVEINIVNILLEGRNYLYASARDITNRKRAEEEIKSTNEELIKLNAEKDKFFSIIAHDLRSPFMGLMGMSEIMAADVESYTRAEWKEFGKSMNKTTENIYKLINNLLEWSQLQKGILQFMPEVFNLKERVDQAIETINQRALQKGISILNKVEENQKVYADEKMIGSILRNLLSNAVKFTREGGEVIVNSRLSGNELIEISVSDTGIGISQKNIARLFKIDEKVSSPGTDGEPSAGLGLLLCKEFVEKHGGNIWVTSLEGKGTEFYFSIPTK